MRPALLEHTMNTTERKGVFCRVPWKVEVWLSEEADHHQVIDENRRVVYNVVDRKSGREFGEGVGEPGAPRPATRRSPFSMAAACACEHVSVDCQRPESTLCWPQGKVKNR